MQKIRYFTTGGKGLLTIQHKEVKTTKKIATYKGYDIYSMSVKEFYVGYIKDGKLIKYKKPELHNFYRVDIIKKGRKDIKRGVFGLPAAKRYITIISK